MREGGGSIVKGQTRVTSICVPAGSHIKGRERQPGSGGAGRQADVYPLVFLDDVDAPSRGSLAHLQMVPSALSISDPKAFLPKSFSSRNTTWSLLILTQAVLTHWGTVPLPLYPGKDDVRCGHLVSQRENHGTESWGQTKQPSL